MHAAELTALDPLYQVEASPFMAPVTLAHAEVIGKALPRQAAFARALVPALTDALNPPLPILVTLAVLRERLLDGKFGVTAAQRSVRMPLSILVEANGALERFLTPVIAAARQSWLTFNMASKNRPAWQGVCGAFGVELLTTCCCSVIMTEAGQGDTVLASALVRLQDTVRSAADRLAAPVRLVAGLDAVPAANADLTDDELEMFAQIESLLTLCGSVKSALDPKAVLADFGLLRELSAGQRAVHH